MAHIILGWSGIAIHKDLSEYDKICHYYTMKNFIKLYKSNKMHLTQMYDWDDPWELPYNFINTNNITHENELQYKFADSTYVNFIATDANRMLKSENPFYKNEAGAISFTKNNDCDFMWKGFANGYGVCVETKIIDLIDSIRSNKIDSLFIAPIQYIDIENDPKSILCCNERKYYPYSIWMGYIKRKNFIHENEIRMVIQPFRDKEKINSVNVDLNKYINKIVLYPDIVDKECDCKWETHEKQRIDSFRKDFPNLNCDIEVSKIYRCKSIDINDFTKEDLKKMLNTQSSYPKDCKMIYNIDPHDGKKFNNRGEEL